MAEIIPDAQWVYGLDSISYNLGQGFYQWSQNTTNRGGIIATRQGLAEITSRAGDEEVPRGICLFAPFLVGINPYIVVSIGKFIYKLTWPYTGTLELLTDENNNNEPITFDTSSRQVHFEIAVQAQKTKPDGSVTQITPRLVLIMQDGFSNPAYWYYEGQTSHSGHVNPSAIPASDPPWNTPVGTYMKWVGDRLWIARNQKMMVGDLLNPLQFEEQKVTASGGFFYLPANATAMGITHDYKSLLVFTDQTTSAFQAGLEDRELWSQTQDFQRVLFPGIGCTSHRTFVNQYGLSWWMSHDGVVALDSSLQAYQTSRMQVKDHNMSRSKEFVKWNLGGGAAGTFGNWLFFSVPSGSKDNVHTWVLDQSVVEALNQNTPPAWCSNWTGVRPEQWITGPINGTMRCFCISNDVVPEGRQATIWEAFIGQRMDVPKVDGEKTSKDIGCAVETRFLSLPGMPYISVRYAELDLAEIVGNVHLQVYYSGRRTSYKKILDKKLNAQVSNTTDTVFEPGSIINAYVPQLRTVRTETISADLDDKNSGVQTDNTRNIDKEFSFLVTWTGQMALADLKLCVDVQPYTFEGTCEPDELENRKITADGTGSIDKGVSPEPNTFTQALTSTYLSPFRAKWIEFPLYDSASPNGVFFVVEPQFNPAAGGHPTGDYPIDVTITTETPGATIVYTLNGVDPDLETGSEYTVPVSVSINKTLKARAFLTGFTPSAIKEGRYTQGQVGKPVFYPSPDSYPSSLFPMLVTIAATTVGSSVRYTTNNTAVTPSSPLYTTPVSITSGMTLRARGYKTGLLPSEEMIGHYTSIAQAGIPIFIPDEGDYPTYPLDVVMTTPTAGATIRYTRNNPNVGTQGFSVTPPFTVNILADDVLRAISQKAGLADSDVKMATYTVTSTQVLEPSIDPEGGSFNTNQVSAVLHCATPGASMTFTTDGQRPTHSGTHYSDGDTITFELRAGSRTVKVLAFKSGLDDSDIHQAVFNFQAGGGG